MKDTQEVISNWRLNSQMNCDPGASESPLTNLHLDWSEELTNIISKITSSLLSNSRNRLGRWRGTTSCQKQTPDGLKYVNRSLLLKVYKREKQEKKVCFKIDVINLTIVFLRNFKGNHENNGRGRGEPLNKMAENKSHLSYSVKST